MKASHDPRGGGPRSIRLENRGGSVEWLTFEEACALEDQLGAALFDYERHKWESSIDPDAAGNGST